MRSVAHHSRDSTLSSVKIAQSSTSKILKICHSAWKASAIGKHQSSTEMDSVRLVQTNTFLTKKAHFALAWLESAVLMSTLTRQELAKAVLKHTFQWWTPVIRWMLPKLNWCNFSQKLQTGLITTLSTKPYKTWPATSTRKTPIIEVLSPNHSPQHTKLPRLLWPKL
jgi:hypothetical protein